MKSFSHFRWFFLGFILAAFAATSARADFLGPLNPGAENAFDHWYNGVTGNGTVTIDNDDPASGYSEFRIGITNTIPGQTNHADLRSEMFTLTTGPGKTNGPFTFSFAYKILGQVKPGDHIQLALRFFDKDEKFIDQTNFPVGSTTSDSQMTRYKTLSVSNLFAPVGATKADVWVVANIFEPWTSGIAQFDNFSLTDTGNSQLKATLLICSVLVGIIAAVTAVVYYLRRWRKKRRAARATASGRLPRFFRRVCTFLEIICAAWILVECCASYATHRSYNFSFDDKTLHQNIENQLTLGTVNLAPESGTPSVTLRNNSSTAIAIDKMSADLELKNIGTDKALRALIRWDWLVGVLIYCYTLVILDLLRRLFRNVERGATFTDQNVWLLQKIGVTMIAFSLLFTLLDAWDDQMRASYIKTHVAIKDMAVTVPPVEGCVFNVNLDGSDYQGTHHVYNLPFKFDVEQIFTGLLILAIGEVFRQGLLLKKDNELTI